MELISRKDAQAQGLKRYFTGKPCPHGHISERFVKACICYACSSANQKEWLVGNQARKDAADKKYRAENREALRAKANARYAANPRPVIDAARRYVAKNPEKRAAYFRLWLEANRPKARASRKAYRRRKPWITAAATKRRQCRLLKQTPAWAQHDLILKVYEEAARLTRETGIRHEVDHVIPLQGEMVSGLHVEYNLRAIPEFDNRSKGNKLMETARSI